MIKSKSILQQEKEFLKLNEEIDLTTKDLLNQVDQIKEIQSNNGKLCTDWDVPDPLTKFDGTAQENPPREKNQTRSNTPAKSSEENFAVKEYFSTRNDLSPHSDTGSHQRKPADGDTEKIKPNSKSCHSAKITPSIVSAQEQESALSLGIIRYKSSARLREGKLESDVIPETLSGVGNDGITRFLSAKVKLLTQQLEIVQKDEKKHLERIKELQAYKDKSTEEREKLIQQLNMSRSALVKYEQHSNNITAQLQTSHTEISHLKKELETLKKEIRQNNKNHNATEIKLNRTLEETEKLKAALQQVRQEEKECRETQRKKIENLTDTVKKLDRQRTELLNGFKKQLLVIDNLKRQKDLIEAGKLLKCTEDDFISYLDCNPTNTEKEKRLNMQKLRHETTKEKKRVGNETFAVSQTTRQKTGTRRTEKSRRDVEAENEKTNSELIEGKDPEFK